MTNSTRTRPEAGPVVPRQRVAPELSSLTYGPVVAHRRRWTAARLLCLPIAAVYAYLGGFGIAAALHGLTAPSAALVSNPVLAAGLGLVGLFFIATGVRTVRGVVRA